MINEETLTLYYYDDGLGGSERRKIEAALQSDAELAASYANLCRELEQWREAEADPGAQVRLPFGRCAVSGPVGEVRAAGQHAERERLDHLDDGRRQALGARGRGQRTRRGSTLV